MASRPDNSAKELLKTFRIDGSCVYIIGTFDTGVTVFSQQIRALNLAWAAIESEIFSAETSDVNTTTEPSKKIAIVGAGFAGLTIAAGLLKKSVNAEITLFEQRDTLLPLQQGSDSRWLHPRIYDWPQKGSQASAAMLPLLNWTAARASDVVVQVLSQWRGLVTSLDKQSVHLYCNARHLQIHEAAPSKDHLKIEWVGEKRDPIDGTSLQENSAAGKSADFDCVILAVGFGLERDGALSYWRNETIGQPSLDEPRRTFLVSGQGDGAMIDLLRLRISQYRQDRILDELFTGRDQLLSHIEKIHRKYTTESHKLKLFENFETLETNTETLAEFKLVCNDLSRRLRRDTDVILKLKVKNISKLFEHSTSRISFQNKLLVFLLYKCGGFVPSSLSEKQLVQQYGIPEFRVIRRHGTHRDEQLKDMLSEKLYNAIETRRGHAQPDPFSQSDKPCWPGGYFDIPGPTKAAGLVSDDRRSHWRKEYLPGPTELIATSFCAALAGAILSNHPQPGRLRVTLHRSIIFGSEELLQQACDYQGTDQARGTNSAAGRTFPAHNGTIGLAYKFKKIVRSANAATSDQLYSTTKPLRVHDASREMSKEVRFVLAIPLIDAHLEPQTSGVLYIDSVAEDFFVDDRELSMITKMASTFLGALERMERSPIDRIRNIKISDPTKSLANIEPLPEDLKGILELVDSVTPPAVDSRLQLNYDYSDFTPVQPKKSK